MTDEAEAKKNRYVTVREAPDGRRGHCEGGTEHHLGEGAVMVAFAVHLLSRGASAVSVHPDGEHLKRYDPKAALQEHGFEHVSRQGRTPYGGVYSRGAHTVTIIPKPGLGDVVAQIDGKMVVAECKGGVVNTRHPGQLSRLRRGLCEAVGLLMSRTGADERQIAVVPRTGATFAIAQKMGARAQAAGIEIALVDGSLCEHLARLPTRHRSLAVHCHGEPPLQGILKP